MALTKISTALITPDAINGTLIADDAIAAEHIADNAVDIARLNVTDGTTGQALITNGSNSLSFATIEGAYSNWQIVTGNHNAAHKQQIICNSTSAITVTLMGSPNVGDTVIICNAGSGLVTIARNGNNINSAADDGTLPQGNSVQLVRIDATIGYFEV